MENVKSILLKIGKKMKPLKSRLIIIAIIFIVFGIIFVCKGFDVKNNYYLSENYPRQNKHAYVGGDAYNYIINANYFTGYIVLASSCFICGVILVKTSLLLKNTSEGN